MSNKIIQFQNGQKFDGFQVNRHDGFDPGVSRTVTVQLFRASDEDQSLVPVGYIILEEGMAFELGNEIVEASGG